MERGKKEWSGVERVEWRGARSGVKRVEWSGVERVEWREWSRADTNKHDTGITLR